MMMWIVPLIKLACLEEYLFDTEKNFASPKFDVQVDWQNLE